MVLYLIATLGDIEVTSLALRLVKSPALRPLDDKCVEMIDEAEQDNMKNST